MVYSNGGCELSGSVQTSKHTHITGFKLKEACFNHCHWLHRPARTHSCWHVGVWEIVCVSVCIQCMCWRTCVSA